MDYSLVDTQTVNDANIGASLVDVASYTDAVKAVRLSGAVDVGVSPDGNLAAEVETILTLQLYVDGRFVTESRRLIPAAVTEVTLLLEPFLLEQNKEAVLKLLSNNPLDTVIDVTTRLYIVMQTDQIIELTAEEVLNRVRSIRTYSARTK